MIVIRTKRQVTIFIDTHTHTHTHTERERSNADEQYVYEAQKCYMFVI